MTALVPETRPAYAGGFVIPAWCDTALANVIEHYTTKAMVPLPERRYWTIGETAHDCEQMVLCVQQMFLGTSAFPAETSLCNGPRGMTFTIEVIRCVPGLTQRGQAPAALDIQEASVDPVIDLEILMDCAQYFDEFSAGIVVTADVVPANGAVHGAIATYTVNL